MDDNSKLSRRSVIKHATALAGAALTLSMIPIKSAHAQKAPKDTMKYQDTPMGAMQCDNCTYWIAPASCGIVEGAISPKGYCIGYNKKA